MRENGGDPARPRPRDDEDVRARRRRWILLGALALFMSVATWHYATLYREAMGARTALLALEQQADALGLDAEAADLDRTEQQLSDARGHIERARAHLRWDPALQAARLLPVVGDQVDAASGLLEAGEAVVGLGEGATALGRDALAVREAHDGGEPMTAAALGLIEAWAEPIARLEALADDAVRARLAIGDDPLLRPLDDARRRLDEQLPRLVQAIEHASDARELLPALLGFEGERRYLLLSLNNAELMPGGGLITVAGVITVRDGHPVGSDFRDAQGWVQQWVEMEARHLEAPGPLDRYLLKGNSWNLGLSGWDPDFEAWARDALHLYEEAWGPQDVDGVVAVDLDVLRTLLDLTGAQTVEAPGFGQVSINSKNAFLELERVTRAPEGTWRRSKSAVGALQEQLLDEVLALPPDEWSTLVRRMQELAAERHLQVLLFDPATQDIVRDLGWVGGLDAAPGDYLHLSEASVNSTKLNAVFAPEATYRIDVTALGTARHDLRLRYHNTVQEWAHSVRDWTEKYDPDLVQHLMFDGQYGGYLRAFVPADATAFSVALDGVAAGIEDEGGDERHRWFGIFVPVAAGEEREVAFGWSVPAASSAGTYELLIQKQAGTAGMCFDLDVTREGRPPTSLEVTGGTRDGDGRHCLTTDISVRARFE